MSLNLHSNSSGNTVIKLSGELSVSNAAELKNLFADALKNDSDIEIDHSEAEEFDFAYLQLLTAFLLKLKKLDRKIIFTPGLPEELKRIANTAGFLNLNELFNEKEEA